MNPPNTAALSPSFLRRVAIKERAFRSAARWPSIIAILLGIVLFTSTIAMLPQMILFWQTGLREGLTGGFGYRLAREGSWIFTLLLFAWALLYRKIKPVGHRSALLAAIWVGMCALCVVVWSSVVKDVPVIVQVIGLRMLTYTPAIWIGFVLMRSSPERAMRALSYGLIFFLVIQVSVSLIQNSLGAGAVKDARDFLGTRSFGTFANVNQFAAATVGASALLLATFHIRSKRQTLFWLFICFFLAVMSGSRTGMVTTLFMLAYAWLEGIRIDPLVRLLAYVLSPVLVMSAVVYFGTPAFTGREVADPLDNNRVHVYSWLGESMSGPSEVLLGDGLGYSTSAYAMLGTAGLVESEEESRRYMISPGETLVGNTHSSYLTLIANYGIGSLFLFGWLLLAGWTCAHRHRRVIVLGVFVAGIPNSLVESFPAIFLVYLAMGIILATPPIAGSWERKARAGTA